MKIIKDRAFLKNIVKKYKDAGKVVVLVTGVYDILHIGHIRFLKKAKAAGDILVVVLDGDRVVQYIKGGRRPINNENSRAEVLACLEFVDHIFVFDKDKPQFSDWLNLCKTLRVDILAVSENDPLLVKKRIALKEIGCRVEVVIPFIKNQSTTRLAKLLAVD